ncbi:MAG: hypothetical protein JWO03_1187, partial [Bacteroidetes bacterium]|nr:hypothetical protein [Bacteroidota bacterium]
MTEITHYSKRRSRQRSSVTTVIAVFLLMISTTSAFAGDCAPLSGELKIGKTDGDYSSVSAAVTALKCGGISGPVTFLLEDGTYPEKIDLSDIPGVSAKSTVTFESAKGNNSDVILTSTSADAEYTLRLTGSSYVIFENLTIENKSGNTGNAIRIDGSAHHLTFRNVLFNGAERTNTGANSAVIYSTSNGSKNSILIENCSVNNGSMGIYKGGGPTEDTRTSITGTLFFNQYESAIALNNETAPVLSNNVISSVSNYKEFKAIAMSKIGGEMIISSNVVNAVNGIYGLFLKDCGGTSEKYASVSNNAVNVGGDGAMYGLYLVGSTDTVVFNFNRVKLTPSKQNATNQAYYK